MGKSEIIRGRVEFCDIDFLANLFGVSVRTIHNYRNSGMPSETKGTYDLQRCVRWFVNTKLDQQSKSERYVKDEIKNDPETRLTIARAVKIERENAEAEKELIKVEIFTAFVSFLATTTANSFESLGARLCHDLADMDNPEEIQDTIWKESRQTRRMVANKVKDLDIADIYNDD